LVVVSHDRHLIKSVADTLWLVADGKLQEFAGDLDDYQQWLRSRGKTPQSAPSPTHKPKPTRTPARAGTAKSASGNPGAGGNKSAAVSTPAERNAQRRDPLTRLRRQLEQVEARIAALAAERSLLEAELAANPPQDKPNLRRANLQRDAAYLETQWMEIGTAIEVEEAKIGN
jgi:ATP-binding cassette subfamily F protein 3